MGYGVTVFVNLRSRVYCLNFFSSRLAMVKLMRGVIEGGLRDSYFNWHAPKYIVCALNLDKAKLAYT